MVNWKRTNKDLDLNFDLTIVDVISEVIVEVIA